MKDNRISICISFDVFNQSVTVMAYRMEDETKLLRMNWNVADKVWGFSSSTMNKIKDRANSDLSANILVALSDPHGHLTVGRSDFSTKPPTISKFLELLGLVCGADLDKEKIELSFTVSFGVHSKLTEIFYWRVLDILFSEAVAPKFSGFVIHLKITSQGYSEIALPVYLLKIMEFFSKSFAKIKKITFEELLPRYSEEKAADLIRKFLSWYLYPGRIENSEISEILINH